MSSFRLSSRALKDIGQIWGFIADDSIRAADRVEIALFDAFKLIGSEPLMGHLRRDLTKRPLRFWTLPSFDKYMVVYDPSVSPVRIVRILHGSRNLAKTLKSLR